MSEKLRLLDQALALSEAELDYLNEGDFARAEESSAERGELIRRVLAMKDEPTTQDDLIEKLKELRNMQGRLTTEAKRLHAELKEDLVRTSKEAKRFGGYQQAAGMRQPTNSRFISKRG